jgi:hypothetical protein
MKASLRARHRFRNIDGATCAFPQRFKQRFKQLQKVICLPSIPYTKTFLRKLHDPIMSSQGLKNLFSDGASPRLITFSRTQPYTDTSTPMKLIATGTFDQASLPIFLSNSTHTWHRRWHFTPSIHPISLVIASLSTPGRLSSPHLQA